jgi:hypothetical protein
MVHTSRFITEEAAAAIKSSKSSENITFFAAQLQWRSLGLKLEWGSRRNVYKIRTIGLASSIAVRKDTVAFDAKIEDIHICESDPIGPYGTVSRSRLFTNPSSVDQFNYCQVF